MDEKNKLYFGDNLKILRDYVADASVDLIYLDPPFNSQATYNVLFKEKSGEESAAQIMAFEDTWQWGRESEAVYREIVESGPRKLADLMQALLACLGRNDIRAYLVTIGIRLVEFHRAQRLAGQPAAWSCGLSTRLSSSRRNGPPCDLDCYRSMYPVYLKLNSR